MANAKNTDTVDPNVAVVAPDPEADVQQDVPGGRYLVNGKLVDANGKPIKGSKAEDGE